LCDRGTCPLDAARGVDVVLDYRARPHPRPTAYEDGISCALRRHIPLVVGGTSALNPFDRWTTAVAGDDDIVPACEQASGSSIESLAAPARAEVRRILHDASATATGSGVAVRRLDGAIDVVVDLPDDAEEVESRVAVAVAGVVRAHDRTASQINVAVRRRERVAP
jgi:hypothetical protein